MARSVKSFFQEAERAVVLRPQPAVSLAHAGLRRRHPMTLRRAREQVTGLRRLAGRMATTPPASQRRRRRQILFDLTQMFICYAALIRSSR